MSGTIARKFFACALVVAGGLCSASAAPAQQTQRQALPIAAAGAEVKPSAGYRGRHDMEPPRTRREPKAKIRGRFRDDRVLGDVAHRIRKDGAGECDSITEASDAGADRAVVVCNSGKNAYLMQKKGKDWRYTVPAGRDKPLAQK